MSDPTNIKVLEIPGAKTAGTRILPMLVCSRIVPVCVSGECALVEIWVCAVGHSWCMNVDGRG